MNLFAGIHGTIRTLFLEMHLVPIQTCDHAPNAGRLKLFSMELVRNGESITGSSKARQRGADAQAERVAVDFDVIFDGGNFKCGLLECSVLIGGHRSIFQRAGPRLAVKAESQKCAEKNSGGEIRRKEDNVRVSRASCATIWTRWLSTILI